MCLRDRIELGHRANLAVHERMHNVTFNDIIRRDFKEMRVLLKCIAALKSTMQMKRANAHTVEKQICVLFSYTQSEDLIVSEVLAYSLAENAK